MDFVINYGNSSQWDHCLELLAAKLNISEFDILRRVLFLYNVFLEFHRVLRKSPRFYNFIAGRAECIERQSRRGRQEIPRIPTRSLILEDDMSSHICARISNDSQIARRCDPTNACIHSEISPSLVRFLLALGLRLNWRLRGIEITTLYPSSLECVPDTRPCCSDGTYSAAGMDFSNKQNLSQAASLLIYLSRARYAGIALPLNYISPTFKRKESALIDYRRMSDVKVIASGREPRESPCADSRLRILLPNIIVLLLS